MTHPLLQDPLDRAIVSLLAVSHVVPLEKRIWLNLLPHMTEKEKNELKEILEEEVKYEIKTTEEETEKFLATLEKGI